MRTVSKIPVLNNLVERGQNGTSKDIDYIMNFITIDSCIVTIKLADFALGNVRNTSGQDRIEYYLFNGSEIQRNYAALFFKRKRCFELLGEAVARGLISREHAFSK